MSGDDFVADFDPPLVSERVGVVEDRFPRFAVHGIESEDENGGAAERIRHPVDHEGDTLND